MDMITPSNFINKAELSYADDRINVNYLNLDHKVWYHPAYDNVVYYDSFFDLYDKALNDTLNAIDVVNDFLLKKKIDYNKFNDVFKDLSYVTGKNYKFKLKMKKFEF